MDEIISFFSTEIQLLENNILKIVMISHRKKHDDQYMLKYKLKDWKSKLGISLSDISFVENVINVRWVEINP